MAMVSTRSVTDDRYEERLKSVIQSENIDAGQDHRVAYGDFKTNLGISPAYIK